MNRKADKLRDGEILDNATYLVDDMIAKGFSLDEMNKMRAEGAPARLIGNKLRFAGDEVNAWVRKQPVHLKENWRSNKKRKSVA